MLSCDASDAFENVHSNSTRVQYIFSPKCCFYIKGNIGKCFYQIWTVCVCNARVLSRNSAYIPDNHDVPSVGYGGRPICGAGRFRR